MKERKNVFDKKEIFEIDGFLVSDIGLKRDNNEDNYLLDNSWNRGSVERIQESYKKTKAGYWTYIGVFDGMGGGEKGEWASLVAAQEVNESLFRLPLNDISINDIDSFVQKGFLQANNQIVEESQHCAIFGTTGTILVSNGVKFRIYHLGDSRAYLFRDGKLKQLTTDQTLAELKIQLGYYEEGNPQIERDKHQLTDFIGNDSSKERLNPSKSEWIDWKEGDQILLCSDGLYDMCPDDIIAFVLEEEDDLRKKANQLLTYALRNGGRDNVTCIVLSAHKKERQTVDYAMKTSTLDVSSWGGWIEL